uniref:Type I inositol 3,4-bisphosphate 4-phosphatase n=2 Tax=Macrostomum lignano TaxID=282301 RepID=A0A1I8J532_9PLAT
MDAFALLEAVGEFLGPLSKDFGPEEPRLAELQLFLSYACPFGTPLALEQPLYRHLFGQVPSLPAAGSREAAESPHTVWTVGAPAEKKSKKGSSVALQLTERVYYSCQDENSCHSRQGDNYLCFGCLTCDASLLKENCSLEIRLDSPRQLLHGVLVTPRCAYWDATPQSARIRLQPPRQAGSRLITYWLAQPLHPLVTGFYQVR